MSFADRLWTAIRAKQTPAIVGLDPRAELLPPALLDRYLASHGASLRAVALAYEEFCSRLLDVVAALVPAVKVQVAFFEALGPAGAAALSQTLRKARRLGLLVIADAKRGDIGATAEAYAQGWLTGSPVAGRPLSVWDADALTVHPYLGMVSLEPFLKAVAGAAAASEAGRGVFVLVRTSNPGARQFQDIGEQDAPLYLRVAQAVEQLNAGALGQCGYGPVGAVVGATHADEIRRLRPVVPHTLFLVPGYGAQGGRAVDLAAAFDPRGFGALVSNSRGIIFAYREPRLRDAYPPERWEDVVAQAALEMIEDLAKHTPAGHLRQSRS